jgi:hypothetical protein
MGVEEVEEVEETEEERTAGVESRLARKMANFGIAVGRYYTPRANTGRRIYAAEIPARFPFKIDIDSQVHWHHISGTPKNLHSSTETIFRVEPQTEFKNEGKPSCKTSPRTR